MTVLNIDTDYDAYVRRQDSLYGKFATGTVLRIGYDYIGGKSPVSNYYRTGIRFDLTSLPSGADVTQVRLKVRCSLAGGIAHSLNIRPYNGDAQADPAADSAALFYARCAAGTPYVTGSGALQTTGEKWFNLGSQACTDVENAKAAVNRFSLGLHELGDNDDDAEVSSMEYDGYDPLLEITYTVPAIGGRSWGTIIGEIVGWGILV